MGAWTESFCKVPVLAVVAVVSEGILLLDIFFDDLHAVRKVTIIIANRKYFFMLSI